MTETIQGVLSRTIALPVPGDVEVCEGEKVSPGTLVAKTTYISGNVYAVDARRELHLRGIPADNLRLIKSAGETVRKGELLAEALGAGDAQVFSPCTGFVEYVSQVRSSFLIREDPQYSSPLVVIDAADKLDVKPRWIRLYCLVKEGDEVREGQAVAMISGQGQAGVVYSPISGVIARICSKTGHITVVRKMSPLKVYSDVFGRVHQVLPGRGAIISSRGYFLKCFAGAGESSGRLKVLVRDPRETLSEDLVTEDCRGKIIVAGAYASEAVVRKASEIEAAGIVAGGIAANVWHSVKERWVEYKSQESLPEWERVQPFAVALLGGFGVHDVEESTWQLLVSSQGRLALIQEIEDDDLPGCGIVRAQVFIDGEEDFSNGY